MKMLRINRSMVFVALLVAAVMANGSGAFSVISSCKPKDAMASTTAISYAMQMPDFAAGLPKSTWYDVANPTARRIVYDE